MTYIKGARHDILAEREADRCQVVTPWPPATGPKLNRGRCVYTAGHDGLHYSPPFAWGTGERTPANHNPLL